MSKIESNGVAVKNGSDELPMLSSQAEQKVKELSERYPNSKSAIMPALYIAQEELGWCSDQAYRWVSDRLGLATAHVIGVATFYTMYYKKPVGRYHIQVCRTLSCAICGAQNLSAHIKKRFGLESGEVSQDGNWSFEEVECLGSCGTAPMVEINDVYFENLNVEKLENLLERIEKEKPDLRYSAVREELGGGLADHSRSCAWTTKGVAS